jgi:hypothetical protein
MSYINFSGALKLARVTQIATLIGNSATLNIWAGTMPATPDTAISGGTLLVSLPLSNPPATEALGANAVLTFNSITQENASNTGTAAFARIANSTQSTGQTAGTVDLDVGTSGTSVILNTTSIVASGPVQVQSASISEA